MPIIRKGFTLIELIIVITIMGLVAALVAGRLSSLSSDVSVLTPGTIKNYLAGMESSKKLTLFCYDQCSRCDVWEGKKKIRKAIALHSSDGVKVWRINRYGQFTKADAKIIAQDGELRSGCFEFSLYSDGKNSPLILEAESKFYLYTPLGGLTMSGASNSEQVKNTLYDRYLIPMRKEDYYENR
ncbi:MAG: prepilin-type N-terminal cleavage/methylation domain-containing protein [Sulfuricurvum sp.]|nr:prepilin-type N-terminal cleavage/methylation domain-containing protein [Sulfuricurvum sp.]